MKYYAEYLTRNHTISFRPKGNSMAPLIKSGELITLESVKDKSTLKVHDIVLCRVKGKYYVHKITAISPTKGWQIGNNKGFINGWTNQIYGKVIAIGE